MDMRECKIIFPAEMTQEQAEKLLNKHAAGARFDTYAEKRQIGCNTISFGIVTIPLRAATALEKELGVMRVETLSAFQLALPQAKGGCCGGGGCGCKG